MAGYFARISNISGAKSSVESSAYISREKIHDDEHDRYYNYSKHKQDSLFEHVKLCDNAPIEWQDKKNLWNAVEHQEKAKSARKAKQWILAIPQELDDEQAKQAVMEFQDFLAEIGMCSQANIHEPESKRSATQVEKNRHVHVLATQRLIDKDGNWEKTKQKQEYANDIDRDGKPRYNPNKPTDPNYRIPKTDSDKVKAWEEKNGRKFDMAKATQDDKSAVQRIGKNHRREWVRVTVENNPLYARELIEESRAKWAEVCNKHLTQDNTIDHRSYERQGIDRIAQIHEGVGSHKNHDDRVRYNEEVKKINELIENNKTDIRRSIDDTRQSYESYKLKPGAAKVNGRDDGNNKESASDHNEPGTEEQRHIQNDGIVQNRIYESEYEQLRQRNIEARIRLLQKIIGHLQETGGDSKQSGYIGNGGIYNENKVLRAEQRGIADQQQQFTSENRTAGADQEPTTRAIEQLNDKAEIIRNEQHRIAEKFSTVGTEQQNINSQIKESEGDRRSHLDGIIRSKLHGIKRELGERIENFFKGIFDRKAELTNRNLDGGNIATVNEPIQKQEPITQRTDRPKVSLKAKLPEYQQKADEINQQNQQQQQRGTIEQKREKRSR